MQNETVEIPCIVGGKEVLTGNTHYQVAVSRLQLLVTLLVKTANISQYYLYHWFFHKVIFGKWAKKFYTDDASLPKISIVLLIVWKMASTYQKHCPDLGNDASSVWNFCTYFSDIISFQNHWWHRKIMALFSGHWWLSYNLTCFSNCHLLHVMVIKLLNK